MRLHPAGPAQAAPDDLADPQATRDGPSEAHRSPRREAAGDREDAPAGGRPRPAEGPSRLASLVGRVGDIPGAEGLIREALATSGGPDRPGQAGPGAVLNDLGLLAARRGLPEVSEALLRRSLDLCRASVGEHHPRFATALNNLALALMRRGDLRGAGPLLRRSLRIRRDRLAEGHPDLAASLSSLGLLHQERGELTWAKLMYREALEVRRKALGDRHPLTIQGLAELAMVSWHQRDWARADDRMAEVQAAQEASLGGWHPALVATLSLRAVLARKRGDAEGAGRLLRRATEVRGEALEEGPPLNAGSLEGLARLLLRRGGLGDDTAPAGRRRPGRGSGPGAGFTVTLRGGGPAGPAAPDRAADAAPPSGPGNSARPPVTAGSPPAFERREPAAAKARRPWSPPMEPSSHDLSRELAELAEVLAGLGERFLVAASQLQDPGSFPDPGLMAEVDGRRGEFASLRDRAVWEAGALGVDGPPTEDLDSVQGLARLLDAVAAEGARREGAGAARRRAREVLEGVGVLVHRGPAPHPALAGCQAAARALGEALEAEGDAPEASPEVRSLAEGDHPLAGLLRLVHHREGLDDEEWAGLYDRVGAAFGKALAAAVAMSRIGPPPGQAPAPGPDGPPGAGRAGDADPGPAPNGVAPSHAVSQ